MSETRGLLTKEVQKIAIKVLSREITTIELRLMPYIQYTMVNEQKLDPNKINQDERDILKKWRN